MRHGLVQAPERRGVDMPGHGTQRGDALADLIAARLVELPHVRREEVQKSEAPRGRLGLGAGHEEAPDAAPSHRGSGEDAVGDGAAPVDGFARGFEAHVAHHDLVQAAGEVRREGVAGPQQLAFPPRYAARCRPLALQKGRRRINDVGGRPVQGHPFQLVAFHLLLSNN